MSALMPTYARADIVIDRGQGSYLFDVDGRDYLDLAAGIAVNIFGHGHPALVAALKQQGDRLWHCSNLYRIPEQERLAAQLVEASFADRVFFTNSGAEAMECAIKAAKRYQYVSGHPERRRFICFSDAFHGRTLATLSASPQQKVRDGFEPGLDWFDFAPFNDGKAVEALIDERTAGIIVEPIQGEGGLQQATPEFLRQLRLLTGQHGLVLIFDEIQTGIGRTGQMFAYEHFGVTPDILASAKGLGGGFPIGACLATEHVGEAMSAGTHGSTYGGNPLGCAVASAVLDVLLSTDMLDRVRHSSDLLRGVLDGIVQARPELFTKVRGVGLMLGLKARIPAREFVNHARAYGVMTAAGNDVVRILPPLNITDEDIIEGERRLIAAAEGWCR